MPRHFNETFDERYDSREALQHFGVKGMRWGKHTAGAGDSGGGRSARREARAAKSLSKAQTKLAAKTEKIDAANKRDDAIVSARENLGKTANAVKLAKSQYKVDKHILGKKAAKEVLNKAKNEHLATMNLASQNTGREQAAANKEFFKSIALGSLKALA